LESRNRKLLLELFFFTLITALLIFIRIAGGFQSIDQEVYAHFTGTNNLAVKIITETASIYFVLVASALIGIYQLLKLRGFSLNLLNFISSLVLVSLLTLLIKYFTAVPRPGEAQVATSSLLALLSDIYSFPSGHTSRASVVAYFLSKQNRLIAFLSWLYVIIIAFTRIVLAVHWFSDVLVGIFLGLSSSLAVEASSPHLEKAYRYILRDEKRIIKQAFLQGKK